MMTRRRKSKYKMCEQFNRRRRLQGQRTLKLREWERMGELQGLGV